MAQGRLLVGLRHLKMSCSQCAGIEVEFDHAKVAKKLRRFQRRGPDKTTRLLIEALRVALGSGEARDTRVAPEKS